LLLSTVNYYVTFHLFSMCLRTHSIRLFPYTTLFRSTCVVFTSIAVAIRIQRCKIAFEFFIFNDNTPFGSHRCSVSCNTRRQYTRSEEHTSELQSRFDLVCRLLLEKKKET